MPRKACEVCGGAALRGSTRCGFHPRAATPSQQRAYRGLAAYRDFRDQIIARDAGICAVCARPGADVLGHRTPYRDSDPETRDDPTRWDPADFAAVHDDCNKRLGARPMTGRP